MGLLDDLEEIAGPTSQKTIRRQNKAKNRIKDGIKERQCFECKKWLTLDHFSSRTHISGYGISKGIQCACKPCAIKLYNRNKLKKKLHNAY